jgi:hypothetical protein
MERFTNNITEKYYHKCPCAERFSKENVFFFLQTQAEVNELQIATKGSTICANQSTNSHAKQKALSRESNQIKKDVKPAELKCKLCINSHSIRNCQAFMELGPKEKYNEGT